MRVELLVGEKSWRIWLAESTFYELLRDLWSTFSLRPILGVDNCLGAPGAFCFRHRLCK